MIPDVDFLKSSPMSHKFGDLFNPPALTNFLGVLHCELDLTAISSLSFPPFSVANNRTAGLFIDDRFFQATANPVTFTWYPDRITREADYKGLKLTSITVMPVMKMAAIIRLQIENRSGAVRKVDIRLALNGGITQEKRPWKSPVPPSEDDNEVQIDGYRNALIFSARHSQACQLQGTNPKPDSINRQGVEFTFTLNPGGIKTIDYVCTIGESLNQAREDYDSIINNVGSEIKKARADWNAELNAIFTPGNPRYSGSLPELYTADSDILRMYVTSILGVVYFKRDNPNSVYGRVYDTLMPKYWQTVTFIWDYALSSFIHTLLDPGVMQKYLERWMQLDIYHHFGTEYLTGDAVGYWYAANDFNMMVLLNDYLCWTGKYDWLQKEIFDLTGKKKKSRRVIEFVDQYASSWNRFKSKNGLADYGGINNLLECVSTYIHEVASLNAANVFNLRSAGQIMQAAGLEKRGRQLLTAAENLLQEVNKLYAPGRGFWFSRMPDGTLMDVRHCYDFFTIINTIGDDLTERQKEEMLGFFVNEFQTEKWMRALAPSDSNAFFSVRPDHQWDGAYPAWPAHSLKALYKIGRADLAFRWLQGLVKSFNQGPLGQAHFVEDVIPPEDGGARKAPFDYPYMTDWACSGSGSWVSVVIESIFGVKAGLDGKLSAHPQFSGFDPKAELHNLMYRGNRYVVTNKGLIKD